MLRWKGGAITELSVPLKRKPPQRLRTEEDTIDLLRRLAVHYPDATIAGILNRQHRRTARGLSFTASRVQSLRHHWKIPCHQPSDDPHGRRTAHRGRRRPTNSGSPRPPCTAGWATGSSPASRSPPARPGASASPTTSARCSSTTPPTGWLAMLEATLAYGVSRQTLMQRVKRGELQAVHVRTGRRKGLRIQPPTPQDSLF